MNNTSDKFNPFLNEEFIGKLLSLFKETAIEHQYEYREVYEGAWYNFFKKRQYKSLNNLNDLGEKLDFEYEERNQLEMIFSNYLGITLKYSWEDKDYTEENSTKESIDPLDTGMENI